jgi:hypothetical protein
MEVNCLLYALAALPPEDISPITSWIGRFVGTSAGLEATKWRNVAPTGIREQAIQPTATPRRGLEVRFSLLCSSPMGSSWFENRLTLWRAVAVQQFEGNIPSFFSVLFLTYTHCSSFENLDSVN